MTDDGRKDRLALRALTAEQRTALLRMADAGEQHPDPAVRLAAYRWSHDVQWDRRSNRLPGWLLPVTAIVVALAFVAAGVALDVHPGAIVSVAAVCVIVVAMGILGWMGTATARTLRAVYPTAPDTT